MQVKIVRPNGYRGNGVSASCGQVVEVSDAVAADLIASGAAVAVGAAVPAAAEVEHVAPVLAAARNGAYRNAKKKG